MIKSELPELSRKNLKKAPELDLRKLDTNILLNFAESTARSLRTIELEPEIRIKKSNFFETIK